MLHKWFKKQLCEGLPLTSEDGESRPSISSNAVIQILLQFGGGVLFATVFVHLIPDTKKNFETYLKSNKSIFKHSEAEEKSYEAPIVEIVICSGFFVIFIVEELMHFLLNRYNSHQKVHHVCYKRDLANRCSNVCVDSHENQIATETKPITSRTAYINYGADMSSDSKRKVVHSYNSSNTVSAVKDDHKNNDEKNVTIIMFCRGLVTIFAFSVHSIFDGLAIGLQNKVTDLWSMFFAISVHKLVIAFVVSVQLFDQSKSLLLVSIHMTLFSIMSPIGILIVVLTEDSVLGEASESNPIVILLISLATGTLLYIIFYEILQKDRCQSISGFIQFLSIFFGFGLMLTINILLSD